MQPAVVRFQPSIPPEELLRSLLRVCVASSRPDGATAAFEQRFAEMLGIPRGIAVSSVRYGLYRTLGYLRFPPGTEILCTSLTVYPVMDVILLAGYKPVFVDLKPATTTPDLKDAQRKITPATRVLLVTHLWGVPCDMKEVQRFAERYRLTLLEDASQCLNATLGGRRVGCFGLAGYFSLSATKTVNVYQGAMVVTADGSLESYLRSAAAGLKPKSRWKLLQAILAESALYAGTRRVLFSLLIGPVVASLRRRGKKDYLDNRTRERSKRPRLLPRSINVRFTGVQARTGLFLLNKLDREDRRRRRIAARYLAALKDLPGLGLPALPKEGEGNFWMFAVFSEHREKLREHLWQEGRIDSAIPSIDPCHEMPYFEECMTPLPQTSRLAGQALYLPLYPSLRDDEVERVIQAVRSFFRAPGGSS